MKPDTDTPDLFAFFNEIGIIDQLARALLEARLPKGLIAPHFDVLNHLVRLGDGWTPLRLAAAFQVPKTTMTHTLAGLEKRGLVRTLPNPEDGRSKCVYLTDAGRQLREETIAALLPDLAKIEEVLSPAQIAATLPMLRDVRVFLDKARERSGPVRPVGEGFDEGQHLGRRAAPADPVDDR